MVERRRKALTQVFFFTVFTLSDPGFFDILEISKMVKISNLRQQCAVKCDDYVEQELFENFEA